MNREKEELILAFEAFSASRCKEAERKLEQFESPIDAALEGARGRYHV